ncbi:hypothetical protein QF042_002278 [Pedobacter sp. W3I1]|uniref:hypothetical protein n=1 Tax=Pedobacter sp. W3I1 TaxID=3042291 RepID=UPI0027804D4E|nr:hypothetical protein [Pedobacter sp. W3I1]MDQ0638713.1 hypothetical protein [Pedobacter sp. W3I1]
MSIKQLGKKDTLIIKDNFILIGLPSLLKVYRDWISDNDTFVRRASAFEIRDKLVAVKEGQVSEVIDFLAFCKGFIDTKKKTPEASSAKPLVTVYNSLVDYFRSDYLPITEINY